MLKAIETVYKGYRFRSRLEARWAVFFDALGVPYEYEKEGFELPSGRYLPDFWLPSLDAWFEVKGAVPEIEERERIAALAMELARGTEKNVYVFFGEVGTLNVCNEADKLYSSVFTPLGWGSSYQFWGRCDSCGKVGIGFMADAADLGCTCLYRRRSMHLCTLSDPRIVSAVQKARGARFEHGEKG